MPAPGDSWDLYVTYPSRLLKQGLTVASEQARGHVIGGLDTWNLEKAGMYLIIAEGNMVARDTGCDT